MLLHFVPMSNGSLVHFRKQLVVYSTGVCQEGLQVLLGRIKLTFTFLSAKSKNRELVRKIFLQCIMALTMNVLGRSPRGH